MAQYRRTLRAMTTSDRINIWQTTPSLYKGMAAFQAAASEGLDPVVAELAKIRASQINRCAYCLDMHCADARKLGETQLRLDLVIAWEEAGDLFTEREKAALALTEAITLLAEGPVPDDVYARAAKHFDEPELAALIAQIVAINAWNRFQVTQRAVPQGILDLEAGK